MNVAIVTRDETAITTFLLKPLKVSVIFPKRGCKKPVIGPISQISGCVQDGMESAVEVKNDSNQTRCYKQEKIVLVSAPVNAVFIWFANMSADDTTIRHG